MLPKFVWTAFFYAILSGWEGASLPVLILRIVCCAILGVLAGLAAKAWTKYLLRKRALEYTLTPKWEKLLCAATTVLGGAAGGLTTGIVAPVCGLLLLVICAVVSVTDWLHRIIPNPAVLALLLLKLALALPALLGVPGFPEFDLLQSALGLAVCFIVFSLPGLFGKKVGAGDIKFAAAMGFFLGLMNALYAVIVMGLLIIAYSVFQRRAPILEVFKSFIPMGPFIAVGTYAVYLAAQFLL